MGGDERRDGRGASAQWGQEEGHCDRVEPARLRLHHLRGWYARLCPQLAVRGDHLTKGEEVEVNIVADPRTPGKWQATDVSRDPLLDSLDSLAFAGFVESRLLRRWLASWIDAQGACSRAKPRSAGVLSRAST